MVITSSILSLFHDRQGSPDVIRKKSDRIGPLSPFEGFNEENEFSMALFESKGCYNWRNFGKNCECEWPSDWYYKTYSILEY